MGNHHELFLGVIAIITRTDCEGCVRACPRGKLKWVHHKPCCRMRIFESYSTSLSKRRHPLWSDCNDELTSKKSTFILNVRASRLSDALFPLVAW